MRRRAIGAVAFSVVLCVSVVGGGQAANAADVDHIDGETAAQLVADHTLTLSGEAADFGLNPNGDYISTESGVQIAMPTDAEDGISVTAANIAMEIFLPSAASASTAEETSSGLLAYDNNDGSYSVPIASEYGDLQVNTVIENDDAPREYSYVTSVPANATVLQNEGALVFLDGDGGFC